MLEINTAINRVNNYSHISRKTPVTVFANTYIFCTNTTSQIYNYLYLYHANSTNHVYKTDCIQANINEYFTAIYSFHSNAIKSCLEQFSPCRTLMNLHVIKHLCSFSQLFISWICNCLEAWISKNQPTCRTTMRKGFNALLTGKRNAALIW